MTSSDGVTGTPQHAPRRWGLRNWRVRSRLLALIAVPTVVAVVLGAVGVGLALSGAAAYGRVGTLADVAASVTATVGDIASEQSESAAFVGAGRPDARAQAVADAQRRTDAGTARLRSAAAAVGDGYPESTRDRLRRALFRLDTLPALRTAVTTGRLPAGVTVDRYDTVVTDLLALDDEVAQEGTDPSLSQSVRALGALSRSRAALGTQRALLESALLAGRFDPGGAAAMTRAIAAQDSALEQFRQVASVADAQRYDDVVAGPDVDQTSAIRDGITAGRPPAGGPAAAGSWEASATGALTKVGDVESGLVASIDDRAAQLRSDQQRLAIVVGIVALAVILVVLFATTAVARSLVRPLRALRDGALSVAERRLPDTVARLDREDPDTVDTRVQPIAVYTTDEIGEVARSFDAVHQEAVRAAAGEARRRAQAGALFVTLSRRTQSLVDRQIELIDDLERGEEDAGRLDSLFRLDHLATRMRRNGENLLVLGGQEPVRRWNRRLTLLEVLRAALSEIEQYPRIDLVEVADVTVAESAVSDVVHLLAELLDNATAFSSRQSRVDVTATAMPDGSALVEIVDRGIGLTAQECEELDQRLAAPSDVDVDASRRMGLFVVGRLSARLGSRVWLTPGTPRGVTASVTLPAAVLATPAAEPAVVDGPAAAPSDRSGSDGAWIGERFSRAIATPGPGADSWFGGAPLAASDPAAGTPAAGLAAAGGSDAGAATFVPTASGVTDAGLPRRQPGANEVPGAHADDGADAPPAQTVPTSSGRHAAPDPAAPDPSAGPAAPVPTTPGPIAAGRATGTGGDDVPGGDAADRSPEAIRRRYAGYQRGRRQGLTGEVSGTTGSPGGDGPATGATEPGSATPDAPEPGSTGTGPGEADPNATGPADGSTAASPSTAGPSTAGAAVAGGGVATGAAAVAGTAAAGASGPDATDGSPVAPTSTDVTPVAAHPGDDGTGQAAPRATDVAPVASGGTDVTSGPGRPGWSSPTGDARQGDTGPGRPGPPHPGDGRPGAARPGHAAGQLANSGAATGPADGPTRTGVPAPDVPWGAGPVREPTAAGSTSSGLPLRAPGANYVPGSAADETGVDGRTAGTLNSGPAPGGGGPATGGGGPAPGTPAPGGATIPGGNPATAATGGTTPGATATDGTATDGTTAGGTANGEAPDGTGADGTTAGTDGGRPEWDRSAEAIRRRFAAHQQGRRRGMERTGR